ncbi:MAG: AMP-binding protein, partial [Opitutales bacterium]|nr:AMP-binding protein [Opitutales bacterium]
MKRCPLAAMATVDGEISYDAARAQILKARGELSRQGAGGKIAIFAENSTMWAFSLYGAWLNGSTVIPVDAGSNAEEVAFVLDDAEPSSLCVGRANLETAKLAAEKSANKPRIIVLEDLFSGEAQAPAEDDWRIEREGEELAFIVYTSGTTGKPKGVMLTFANLYANMRAVYEAQYFYDGVRVLAMLPFHHILPLMGTLVMPLSIGGRISFPRKLSPADISEVLQKYPVDLVISVPRFYELLHANIMAKIRESKIASALFFIAKCADSIKFSRRLFSAIHNKFGGEVKYWVSGGAALDRKIWRDLETLGFTICEGYGMTECAPIIAFPRIGKVKIGSPGQPLNGIEIKIDNGEIAVRGENVTSGYWRRPEETAESIR